MKKYVISGFEVWEYEELSSTNTQAEQLIPEELKDKRVILTYRQNSGRGQALNRWESEPGKNISMTVVLRPEAYEASRQFAVSMVCALGVCDFIGHYVKGTSVKWPNDVYVGDRKICGILIEHAIAGRFIGRSLCGIGVNINQAIFCSDAPNPVSLFQLTGMQMDLEKALAELLVCIDQRYRQVKDYDVLEKDFLSNLYRRQGVYKWEDAAGEFEASIEQVDEYGRLVLRDIKGEKRVYGFKEVVYK